MECPSCLQTIENHLARCPFCQASLQGRPANLNPPRARNRELAEEGALLAGQADSQIRGVIVRFFASIAELVPQRIRRFPHSELWLGLLLPGLGHISLGWVRLGLAIMGATGLMLGMLIALAREPGQPDTTSHLFWFGLMLGIVHSHAVVLANRMYPERRTFRAWILDLIIILVLIGQLSLLGWLIYGDRYRLNVRGIRLQAYLQVFAPIFRTGDFLEVNRVSPGNLRIGDLVMIDQYTLDRVLGLEGDVLKIQGGAILRNGNPLSGTQQPVATNTATNRDLPNVIAQTPISGENYSITVGPQQAGVLYWGRHLRAVNIESLAGRIDGIADPPERACRFVNGIRTSR